MIGPYREGPVVLVCSEISYAFPFGIGYLAGYLKRAGEDVRILFRPDSPAGYKQLVQDILDLKPIVVGFGSLYPDLRPTRELIEMLSQGKRLFPIVVGGQMVSPIPEFAVRVTGADFGVIGEGEIILHELVIALREGSDVLRVGGLAVRTEDGVELTGSGSVIYDLSKLPPVPYELFPEEKFVPIGRFYTDKREAHWRYTDRVVSIHGGRGCPFKCNFCYHHSKARYRPIADMMAEARELVGRYKANVLYFGDDLVIASPKRAREMVEAMAGFDPPLDYSVSARFDVLERIDDGLLRDMKEGGCRVMGLGIESGSQRILTQMDKKITVEQIRNGLRRLKEVGIVPTVSIQVGQPGETLEDVEASMAVMKESVRYDKNIQYAFTITTPFPGSPLYEDALAKGLLRDHQDFYDQYDPNLGFRQVIANSSAMSDEEVLRQQLRLARAFRQERKRALGWLAWTVETIRLVLHRSNRILLSKLPTGGPLRPAVLMYFEAYDSVQLALDALRLRLRGLSTGGRVVRRDSSG